MDYEKKYNEALKRAKAAIDIAADKDLVKGVAITIFPELRESEDERIRKWLVNYFSTINETVWIHMDITCEQILAYLEKQKEQSLRDFIDDFPYSDQKEQKPAKDGEDERIRKEIISLVLKVMGQEKDNLSDDKYDAMLAWLEKQKEQNGEDEECTDFTIYHPLKNGKGEYECIPYSFHGSLTSFSKDKDLIDFLRTCFYTEEECNEWIEQQKEQKPAWGEEDERIRQGLIEMYKNEHLVSVPIGVHAKDIIRFLENLRPQPKQEWGEKDEAFLKVAIAICNRYSHKDIADWLKYLRPQPKRDCKDCAMFLNEKCTKPHWRPSEEHLSALLAIFNDPNNIGSQTCQLALTDLYEQLKKL